MKLRAPKGVTTPVACEITSDEMLDIYVGHVFGIVKVLLDRLLVRFVRAK